MIKYLFSVNISYEEFMLVYQSQVKSVIVRENGGKTISLPAMKFISFLGYDGVKGRFELILDNDGRFISLSKLSA